MFIFITYKDAAELSTILTRSTTDIDMAVEKTLLVNPVCPVRIMLEYIRKKCRLGVFTHFDLCDESGILMGLFNMPTYAYATDKFVYKKTYYIIVIKTESDGRTAVIPQLNRENQLYGDLKIKTRRFLSGELGSSSGTPPSKALTPAGTKSSIRKKK